MKRIFVFTFTVFMLFFLSACTQAATPEQLIVGKWVSVAPVSVTDNGVSITYQKLKSTYKKNHSSSSRGSVIITNRALPIPIELQVNIRAQWDIHGEILTETITDIKVDMITSTPNLHDMSERFAEQMKAEGATISTIITLTKNTLILRENDSGLMIEMQRK